MTRVEFTTYTDGSSITNGVDHVVPSFRLHELKKNEFSRSARKLYGNWLVK